MSMKTQTEIRELAKKYAYGIIACAGPNDNPDWVLDMWMDGQMPKSVFIWSAWEDYDASDLLDLFRDFETTFMNFAKEILEKDSQDN